MDALDLRPDEVDPLVEAFLGRPRPRVSHEGTHAEILDRIRSADAEQLRAAITDPRLRTFALALHAANWDEYVEDGGGELVRLAGDVAGPAAYEIALLGEGLTERQVATLGRAIFVAMRPRARTRFLSAWREYFARGHRLEARSADRRAFEQAVLTNVPTPAPARRATGRRRRLIRRRACSRRSSGSDPPDDDDPREVAAARRLLEQHPSSSVSVRATGIGAVGTKLETDGARG